MYKITEGTPGIPPSQQSANSEKLKGESSIQQQPETVKDAFNSESAPKQTQSKLPATTQQGMLQPSPFDAEGILKSPSKKKKGGAKNQAPKNPPAQKQVTLNAPRSISNEVQNLVNDELYKGVQCDGALWFEVIQDKPDLRSPAELRSHLMEHLPRLEGQVANRTSLEGSAGYTNCTGYVHGVKNNFQERLGDRLDGQAELNIVPAKKNSTEKRNVSKEIKYEHVALHGKWEVDGKSTHAIIDPTKNSQYVTYDPEQVGTEGIQARGKKNIPYELKIRKNSDLQKMLSFNDKNEPLTTYQLTPQTRDFEKHVDATLHAFAEHLKHRKFNLSMRGVDNAHTMQVEIKFGTDSAEVTVRPGSGKKVQMKIGKTYSKSEHSEFAEKYDKMSVNGQTAFEAFQKSVGDPTLYDVLRRPVEAFFRLEDILKPAEQGSSKAAEE